MSKGSSLDSRQHCLKKKIYENGILHKIRRRLLSSFANPTVVATLGVSLAILGVAFMATPLVAFLPTSTACFFLSLLFLSEVLSPDTADSQLQFVDLEFLEQLMWLPRC